jgi:hypothetical protein
MIDDNTHDGDKLRARSMSTFLGRDINPIWVAP